MQEVVIGKDVVTGELITLGDMVRRGGVYLCGRSGTGRSALLISLILQEMQMSER